MTPPGQKPRRFFERKRALVAIGLGVLAIHALGFWIFSGFRPMPRRPHIPPPNFTAAEKRVADPATGEVTIYREFTVSTRLQERADEAKE